ncbi:hypothetical protein ABMA08_17440 [Pseudomonas yamanorum]
MRATGRLERQAGVRRLCWLPAAFEQGITEIGRTAHARRKFFDLHANKSKLIEQALHSIGGL